MSSINFLHCVELQIPFMLITALVLYQKSSKLFIRKRKSSSTLRCASSVRELLERFRKPFSLSWNALTYHFHTGILFLRMSCILSVPCYILLQIPHRMNDLSVSSHRSCLSLASWLTEDRKSCTLDVSSGLWSRSWWSGERDSESELRWCSFTRFNSPSCQALDQGVDNPAVAPLNFQKHV